MLVLSRHKEESIEIFGGLIKIMVVEVRGDKVRLGIDAPTWMDVHRDEIAKAIDEEHEAQAIDPRAEARTELAASLLRRFLAGESIAPDDEELVTSSRKAARRLSQAM